MSTLENLIFDFLDQARVAVEQPSEQTIPAFVRLVEMHQRIKCDVTHPSWFVLSLLKSLACFDTDI